MSFSAQMVENFKEAFALFDQAGHGVVTTADLGRVMRALGLEPSNDELENMITEVDGSGKGAVDFAEFMSMMSKNGTSTAAEIKETFTLFNKSGSGSITAADLATVLGELGDPASPEEVQEMINLADVSKAGGVGFADFETIMLD